MQSALKKAMPAYKNRTDLRSKSSTLVCPQCFHPLVREEILSCTGCRRSWSDVGGIPCFSAGGDYRGEVPKGEMIQTNELARKVGWRKAIDEKVKALYPQVYDAILDEAQADFRFILPLQPQSKVLEIGAGFGAISFALQPHCGWVTAVDPIAERARFIETRREQEGLQNMEVAIADGWQLPFAPETFDFIVVNGRLESFGPADPKVNPRLLQKRFLAQLHRLLKPGGAVYIGIKNRFGYDSLFGNGEEGRVGDAGRISRRMADLSPRSFLKEPEGVRPVQESDRPRTYGKRGYRQLLSESGFSETEFFMPYPDYKKPVEMISLDHPYPFQFFLNNVVNPTSVMGKLKKKAALLGSSFGLTQFFSPHFSIVAWKEGRYD